MSQVDPQSSPTRWYSSPFSSPLLSWANAVSVVASLATAVYVCLVQDRTSSSIALATVAIVVVVVACLSFLTYQRRLQDNYEQQQQKWQEAFDQQQRQLQDVYVAVSLSEAAKSRDVLRMKLDASCSALHQLPHWGRGVLAPTQREPSLVSRSLIDLCGNIAENSAKMFGGRHKFAVTIKAFSAHEKEDGKGVVLPVARDVESLGKRNNRTPHSVNPDNTAFNSLLKRNSCVFASDDLTAMPDYMNQTPNRDKFYNATAVVAIRRSEVGADERFEIAGYLCVDALNENGEEIFTHKGKPDEAYKNFLLGHADLLFSVLKRGHVAKPGDRCPLSSNDYFVDCQLFEFTKALNRELVDTATRQLPPDKAREQEVAVAAGL